VVSVSSVSNKHASCEGNLLIFAVILGLPGARKEEATTVDETFFRGGFEPQPNDVFIGVMGVTGADKSTFIEFLADSKDVKIGHGLQSCEVDPLRKLGEAIS
jgi:putative protein kinase ArgK-like GTPase of G3E family